MILRLRSRQDEEGVCALPFAAVRSADVVAAVGEWQKAGGALPAAIDIWDESGKWVRVPHPRNGAAFLLITGNLSQPAAVWPWLERQEQYTAELRAMVGEAVRVVVPAPRPVLAWSATKEKK